MKQKIWQRTARTVEKLESYISQEMFLSPKSNRWYPQFPDVYELLLKEEQMLHSGKHGPVPACFLTDFGIRLVVKQIKGNICIRYV